MDNISVKSIIGEFVGTMGQSMALAALLYNKTKQYNLTLIITTVIVTYGIFYYWSSVRLNPLISLGVTLSSENPDWIRLLTVASSFPKGSCISMLRYNKEEEDYVSKNRLWTILSDAMYTFALVFAYMVLVSDFKQGFLVGIGIAMVYASSLSLNKGNSGGNINFANRLGVAVATKNMTNLLVYSIGPIVGAIIAACVWYLYKNNFSSIFTSCVPVKGTVNIEHAEQHEVDLSEDLLHTGVPHVHTVFAA